MGKSSWSEVMAQMGKEISYADYQNDQNFVKVPYQKLYQASSYTKVNTLSYGCGLNALNLGLKMFSYPKQLQPSQYPPDSILGITVGQFSQNFYHNFVQKLFTKVNAQYCGDDMPFNFIKGTNFENQALIILVQFPNHVICHYILIIGRDKNDNFIVTDQSMRFYLISAKVLVNLMETNIAFQSAKGLKKFNAYRIG